MSFPPFSGYIRKYNKRYKYQKVEQKDKKKAFMLTREYLNKFDSVTNYSIPLGSLKYNMALVGTHYGDVQYAGVCDMPAYKLPWYHDRL